MNIEHFIAKRISVANSGSFTRVIVRIAIAAIAVSLSVMILTTSIISGFKSEITYKIFGFWGHIHITDSNINRSFELTPINKTDKHYDAIRNIKKLEYQSDDKNDGAPVKRNAADRVTIGGKRVFMGCCSKVLIKIMIGTE